jgi:hypothetical protein
VVAGCGVLEELDAGLEELGCGVDGFGCGPEVDASFSNHSPVTETAAIPIIV